MSYFKVGDRIRALVDDPHSARGVKEGDLATITGIGMVGFRYRDDKGTWGTFDGNEGSDWWGDEEVFEKVGTEFKNGDKVSKVGDNERVAVYIGPSQFDSNHLVESKNASLWYWSEGTFEHYVEPKPKNTVNVGDRFKRIKPGNVFATDFWVVGLDDGFADGFSRHASLPEETWEEDGIFIEALENAEEWEKVN